MSKIDLKARFREELCSFDLAKKADKAGVTCANTFFAYDNKGNLTDGAWLASVGYDMYPCINFAFACHLLADCVTEEEFERISFSRIGEHYIISFEEFSHMSINIVDVVLSLYIDIENKR